jgi:hypothetical protein
MYQHAEVRLLSLAVDGLMTLQEHIDKLQRSTRWFSTQRHQRQSVWAAPDAVQNRDKQLVLLGSTDFECCFAEYGRGVRLTAIGQNSR